MGLELQAFSLYILASLKKNKNFSTEAGLKYFIVEGSLQHFSFEVFL
jgi:NADH:ubiquinone oxidoreductase subunit 2 (subunit N)